jgi:hypothetical protein
MQRKVHQLIDKKYSLSPHRRYRAGSYNLLPIYPPTGVRYVPHHQTHFVLARKHQSESAGKTEATSFPVALWFCLRQVFTSPTIGSVLKGAGLTRR